MADPMKVRIRREGDKIDVRILMRHPMETGQIKGKPAHYIQSVKATLGSRLVFESQWGTAISRDPFLGFRFRDAKSGEVLKVTWLDNKGESRTDEALIP